MQEYILQRNLEAFERLCLDQFSVNNNQFLVMMDRFSGYLFVLDPGKKTYSKQVAMKIEKLTLIFGQPQKIRHNDGPHFRGAFLTYLKNIGCESESSSGYYAPSNGMAESGVRVRKHIIMSDSKTKVMLQQGNLILQCVSLF